MNNQQIPVLIISLTQAPKRRKFIREQMARQKIDYAFFDAVDGNKLSYAYLSKFKIKKGEQCLGRPLSKGELGCTFSHLQVYEKMLAENIERLIVLEDDIIINNDFAVLLNNLNTTPPQWDLLHLGYSITLEGTPFFGKNIYPLSLWKNRMLPIPPSATSNQHRIGTPIVSLSGSYAYAITKKGAEQLIQQIKNSPVLPADVRLEINRIKQRLGIVPVVVKHFDCDNLEQHISSDRDTAYKKIKPSNYLFRHRLYKLMPKALRRGIKATFWLMRFRKFP